jgi:hypothetical protein
MGTASTDQAMNEICARKSEALAKFWSGWQRQPARVFKDSELSDQDAARYSLILIGGADANLIARKLSARLPLEIKGDQVKIGSRAFTAPDARVQMIVPNPLNPERYLLQVAATSVDGMFFWSPDRLRNAEFDFMIEDGHVPSANMRPATGEVWVAGGWFDNRWQVQDSLVVTGKPEVRSKSTLLRAPKPGRTVDSVVLDSYVGGYEFAPGRVINVQRKGNGLTAFVGDQPPVELLPVSDMEFFVIEDMVQLVFEKDASGKVASIKGWQNGRDFLAKRVQ